TAGTLAITKTYTLRFGVGPTKGRHSHRTISVPDVIIPMLRAAAGGRTAGPLFPTLTRERRPPPTVPKAWRSVRRAPGLRYHNPHALRHSVATALIGAGVPAPDGARYIGDSIAPLIRCYVPPTWADPAHALNRLYGVHKVGNTPASAGNAK